ncbi:hypothetical protein DERF_008370 [Dermatophagoides farinae]|uniref:Terpene synthase n=1 Tax=Dermatophagoides farinae TaxID=6954 RepID=A0A922I0U3_DERFA|nr:hypothetical protein DERF_008370 [Dermatophagoides farinae]
MPQPSNVEYYDQLDRLNFIYPHYESPFPVVINPNYSQWMIRYCYEWAIDNSGPLRKHQAFVDSIRNSDLGLYSACCFPSANFHRLEKLMKWCTMFFLADDYHDGLSRILSNGQIDYGNFWHQMIDMFDGILTGYQLNYIAGNILEDEWTTNDNNDHMSNGNGTNETIIPNWDSYMKARLGSVGGQMTLQLIEYAKNIALTDQEWNHPLMKSLIDAVSEEMIMVNDHLTFRKEVAEANFKFSRMRHAYTVLVHTKGFTLQEAVNHVHQLIQEKDTFIFDLIDQIMLDPVLNSSTEASERLRLYLEGVKEVLGGYWRYAVQARRYHGQNFQLDAIPPGGHFLYDQHQTIILLNNKNKLNNHQHQQQQHYYEWLKPVPENVQPK